MVITHTSVAAPHIRTSNEQINNLVVPGTAVNKGTALLTVNHMISLPPKFVAVFAQNRSCQFITNMKNHFIDTLTSIIYDFS
jgi:hypothetical protein